jgi:hypothetical protein
MAHVSSLLEFVAAPFTSKTKEIAIMLPGTGMVVVAIDFVGLLNMLGG